MPLLLQIVLVVVIVHVAGLFIIDHWSLVRSAIAYYLFMALFMATGAALVLWLLSH